MLAFKIDLRITAVVAAGFPVLSSNLYPIPILYYPIQSNQAYHVTPRAHKAVPTIYPSDTISIVNWSFETSLSIPHTKTVAVAHLQPRDQTRLPNLFCLYLIKILVPIFPYVFSMFLLQYPKFHTRPKERKKGVGEVLGVRIPHSFIMFHASLLQFKHPPTPPINLPIPMPCSCPGIIQGFCLFPSHLIRHIPSHQNNLPTSLWT